jgi:hypothetical protein
MPREDGINSGARNIGRFFLSLVPWALAIGAMSWLGLWISVHQYRSEVEQERRRAVYVGAEERPKDKIKIEARKVDCLTVERADVDGGSLTMYGRADRTCSEAWYTAWHWQELSPDRTLIHEGYTNSCPDLRKAGDKSECRMKIEVDDRTAYLTVWVSRD